MIKNKKLLIALICFAFCVCCAVFGFGFKSKNSIVANADTIQPATTKTAVATVAKSISLTSDETENFSTITEEPVTDAPEENQDIIYEEDVETEDVEDEITEEDSSNDSETYALPPFWQYITFTGTLRWVDDDNNDHPLRNIKIQIGDNTIYTDDGGDFYLRKMLVIGSEIDIIAYAVDENENVQVTNKDGKLYSYVLESSYAISSTTCDLNEYVIDMSTETGQAFQISQAVITARDFAKEMMGKMPSPVKVVYPEDTTKYDNCCYTWSTNTIHIIKQLRIAKSPASYASWDVIMHEYGHHISNEVGIVQNLGRTYKHYINRNQADWYGNKEIGIHLAWQEGWPTAFGIIAQRYYFEQGILTNINTVGDSYYTAYNDNIDYDINTNAERLGEACEDSIIGVLWDLFDDDVEKNDTIALGYKGFWDVTTKSGTKTFSDFIQNFYKTYPNLIYDIGANLSYYKMASFDLSVRSDDTLDSLPTFKWSSGGGSRAYPNNKFTLVVYDANNKEVLRKSNLTTWTYTLSVDEAKKVYYWDRTIYWTVEASNEYSGILTGPYVTHKQEERPYKEFTIRLDRHVQIVNFDDNYVFKFVAPESGIFTFYTDGGCDTYGAVYRRLESGKYSLLDSDDNSGKLFNFKITLDLQQNECVYIRVKVRAVLNYYAMRVKQE